MKPTIGRIVFYTNLGDKDDRYPPEAHPAIITRVGGPSGEPDLVSLHIFYETGQFDMQNVPYSEEELVRGHWTWPRVPLSFLSPEKGGA